MSKEQSIADRWAEEDRQQVEHIADLETENARLQEREAELEELLFADHEVDKALTARVVKAEALAERHRRALQEWQMGGGHRHGTVTDARCPACLKLVAAIEEGKR